MLIDPHPRRPGRSSGHGQRTTAFRGVIAILVASLAIILAFGLASGTSQASPSANPDTTMADAGEATDDTRISDAAPAPAGEFEAAAYPSNCSYEVDGYWGSIAGCRNHNGGSYRALVHCRFSDGTLRNYAGFWTQGYWSRAYCQGDSRAVSAGIEYSSTDRS